MSVLRFTPQCGRGVLRSQGRVNESGSSTAGTPWTYTGSYVKDPGDGETDEDYNLQFGELEFSFHSGNWCEDRRVIAGPGFRYDCRSGRDNNAFTDLSQLYDALSALAKKEGMPLPEFATELGKGTYGFGGIIDRCVAEAARFDKAKLARSLSNCSREPEEEDDLEAAGMLIGVSQDQAVSAPPPPPPVPTI